MSSPKRPYLGRSAEERVKERRSHLLDTAFHLMASDGWRKITIDKLCREAKLNKRYFYESFADLDELAASVVDDLAADLVKISFSTAYRMREAGAHTDDLAREVMSTVICHLTDDPRRARVLFTEIWDSPRAVAHRRTTINGLASALSAYGYEHHQATGTDPIAELASALLIGGTIEVLITWLDGNIEMSREQLIDDLSALWVLAGDGAVARARARQPDSSES